MQKICNGLAAAVICSCALFAVLLSGAAPSATSGGFAHAIRDNGLTTLQMLASSSAAVNVRDRLQDTPLHYAAIYGSPEAVRILLKAGADPKARNQAGATPLTYAAWSFEKTRLLVENGAEVNTAENGGVTPLMVAASVQGNIATVRYLIEKGANVRVLDGLHGDALMRAASMSDPETLRLLLARGADPHQIDRAGFTALLNATAFPDSERVRLLLAAGADPNQVNSFGGKVLNGPIALVHLSPLMLAVSGGG